MAAPGHSHLATWQLETLIKPQHLGIVLAVCIFSVYVHVYVRTYMCVYMHIMLTVCVSALLRASLWPPPFSVTGREHLPQCLGGPHTAQDTATQVR